MWIPTRRLIREIFQKLALEKEASMEQKRSKTLKFPETSRNIQVRVPG
jgi:hypothetical protein